MWRILRVFKPAHFKVDEFVPDERGNPTTSSSANAGSNRAPRPRKSRWRFDCAVAAVGLVDPLFVRCDDSYPGTLDVLPLWDSMDWLSFAFELERELGRSVRWEPSEIVRHSRSVTVSDLIAHVQGVLEQERTA